MIPQSYKIKPLVNVCHLCTHRNKDSFQSGSFHVGLLKKIYISSNFIWSKPYIIVATGIIVTSISESSRNDFFVHPMGRRSNSRILLDFGELHNFRNGFGKEVSITVASHPFPICQKGGQIREDALIENWNSPTAAYVFHCGQLGRSWGLSEPVYSFYPIHTRCNKDFILLNRKVAGLEHQLSIRLIVSFCITGAEKLKSQVIAELTLKPNFLQYGWCS